MAAVAHSNSAVASQSWCTRRMSIIEWCLCNVLFLCVFILCFASAQVYMGEHEHFFIGDKIVIGINAGGGTHTDLNGVKYLKDPLEGKTGVASDHGKRYIIGRVPHQDQTLYQTERYHTSDFTYELDVPDDGNYVLVLKFSEVYFTRPGAKVFDVNMNEYSVVSYLDIFAKVGHAVAHDELIPFTVQADSLTFRLTGKTVPYEGTLRLTFMQGDQDNPKVNAFYIMRGELSDVPQLPAVRPPPAPEEPAESDHEFDEDLNEQEAEKRAKIASGPKLSDPYESMEQSQMFLPILVALALFFPLLYCLCKL